MSSSTYTQLLVGHHGSQVTAAGKKKLSNKDLYSGAQFSILTGALQFCPEKVPSDVKEKLEEEISKQKNK